MFLWGIVMWVVAAHTLAGVPQAVCDRALSDRIPARQPSAPGGRAFAEHLAVLDDNERESAILRQLLAGNIPQFLRELAPVSLDQPAPDRTGRIVVCVLPDYLAVGSDRDFFLVPMRLRTALAVADRFHFLLPTRRMVDAIYAQAPIHLHPRPLPAGDTMRSTAYYWHHNELILSQRMDVPLPLGTLTAGDKKDLVLTNRLWTHLTSVAIYGWHQPDGRAIQPLSTFHGAQYADYSHGVRLVSATAYVDETARSLVSMLQDSRFSQYFSDEGTIRNVSSLVDTLKLRMSVRRADGLTQ